MGPFIRASWVVTLVILAACGGRPADTGPQPSEAATVEVENRGFADMVIYAVRGSQRIRLGLATGHSTKRFTIPAFLVGGAGPLRFLADPVGGNRMPVSEEMTVQPGDQVTLTIPPQ